MRQLLFICITNWKKNKLFSRSAFASIRINSLRRNFNRRAKILEGIVSFGNTDTRQVMSPRIDIFALEIEESFAVICPKIIKGYSRIPVYRDNIDQIEVFYMSKIYWPHINTNEFDWKSLL
jgi:Mg2+/Co2+ transporter CorB